MKNNPAGIIPMAGAVALLGFLAWKIKKAATPPPLKGVLGDYVMR